MYLLLIVIYLAFILISLSFNNFLINDKIFTNQQQLRLQQIKALVDLRDCCYSKLNDAKLIGFLSDTLVIDSKDGINVYAMSKGEMYGYIGCRGERLIDSKLLWQQQVDYQNLLLANGIIGFSKIKIINFLGEDHSDDRVFFIKDFRELWCYEIKSKKLTLIYKDLAGEILAYEIIRDVAGSKIFPKVNQSNYDCNYLVCLHLRVKNFLLENIGTTDLIKIIKVCPDVSALAKKNLADNALGLNDVWGLNLGLNKNTLELDNNREVVGDIGATIKEISVVTSGSYILNFFVRLNHIIVVYEDLNLTPEIYQLDNINKLNNLCRLNILSVDKSQIKIDNNLDNTLSRSESRSDKFEKLKPNCQLVWDQKRFKHILSIVYGASTKGYTFSLSNDRGVLAYRLDWDN